MSDQDQTQKSGKLETALAILNAQVYRVDFAIDALGTLERRLAFLFVHLPAH